MWKKVLYFGIAIVIGIVVAMVAYSSNQFNHVYNLVNTAIAEKKYEDVAKVFGGCFDTHAINTIEHDQMDIVVFPGTTLTNTVYYSQESEEQTYLVYEEAYYIYIFNPTFNYVNVNDDNQTALRFTSSSAAQYTYPFVVSSTTNKDYYVEKPSNPTEAVMNDARDLISVQTNWNFMSITLTKTMVDYIKAQIGGTIVQMEVLDNEGTNVVYSESLPLDFSQAFFSDISELIDHYNVYLQAYLKDNNDTEAADQFNAFYEPWYEEFKANQEQTGYTFRYDDHTLSPGSLLWQTVGMMALYLVFIILIYILLFHFASIKRIFSRETYKDYSSNKKGTSAKPAKSTPVKKADLTVKEEQKPIGPTESDGNSSNASTESTSSTVLENNDQPLLVESGESNQQDLNQTEENTTSQTDETENKDIES